jgi:hypothetical protein
MVPDTTTGVSPHRDLGDRQLDVASAQTRLAGSGPDHKEAVVTARARGTFEVKLTPQPPGGDAEDLTLALASALR